MEQIFPPSFFTVMVHLVIHLVREVRLGGPVTFRWMYPIERDLMTLKSYVSNKAYPEGSIAEGYLVRESLTFCSRYLSGVETLFTRPKRNDDDDGDNQNKIEESNFLRPGRPLGKHARSELSSLKRKRIPNYEIDDQPLNKHIAMCYLMLIRSRLFERNIKVSLGGKTVHVDHLSMNLKRFTAKTLVSGFEIGLSVRRRKRSVPSPLSLTCWGPNLSLG